MELLRNEGMMAMYTDGGAAGASVINFTWYLTEFENMDQEYATAEVNSVAVSKYNKGIEELGRDATATHKGVHAEICRRCCNVLNVISKEIQHAAQTTKALCK